MRSLSSNCSYSFPLCMGVFLIVVSLSFVSCDLSLSYSFVGARLLILFEILGLIALLWSLNTVLKSGNYCFFVGVFDVWLYVSYPDRWHKCCMPSPHLSTSLTFLLTFPFHRYCLCLPPVSIFYLKIWHIKARVLLPVGSLWALWAGGSLWAGECSTYEACAVVISCVNNGLEHKTTLAQFYTVSKQWLTYLVCSLRDEEGAHNLCVVWS